jgi:hypothetical protein
VQSDNRKDEIGLKNGSARVGLAGARYIVSQDKCDRRYMPYPSVERCVGISVGTGGHWRIKYGRGRREGVVRARRDKVIGSG